MIDLSKDFCLEQMLNIWIRETEVAILNKIGQEEIIEQVSKMSPQNNLSSVSED